VKNRRAERERERERERSIENIAGTLRRDNNDDNFFSATRIIKKNDILHV